MLGPGATRSAVLLSTLCSPCALAVRSARRSSKVKCEPGRPSYVYGDTHVRRRSSWVAPAVTSPERASTIAIGHLLDEPGVSTVSSLRGELHQNATVRQCFERGCDRDAAAFVLDHSGAAILRRGRQTLIRRCSSRGRPRSLETHGPPSSFRAIGRTDRMVLTQN